MSVDRILATQSLDPHFLSYLRFVEPKDAEFICELRSNPDLNRHLNLSSADVAQQREWIERYKDRETSGEEYYFVICHDETDYGVVRMYDFRNNPRSFSWGSWIIKPTRPAGLVTYSAVMIYEIGFECLDFEQAHFDVRKENTGVINFHLRSGAAETGETELDRLFVFPKDRWPSFKNDCSDQIERHRCLSG